MRENVFVFLLFSSPFVVWNKIPIELFITLALSAFSFSQKHFYCHKRKIFIYFFSFNFFVYFFWKKLKENVVKTAWNLQFATTRVIGVFPFISFFHFSFSFFDYSDNINEIPISHCRIRMACVHFSFIDGNLPHMSVWVCVSLFLAVHDDNREEKKLCGGCTIRVSMGW